MGTSVQVISVFFVFFFYLFIYFWLFPSVHPPRMVRPVLGVKRATEIFRHEWGLWPLGAAVSVGMSFLGYATYHNIVDGPALNWKPGHVEKARFDPFNSKIAADGTGINHKVFQAPQHYRERIGFKSDHYAKQNFPPERPNIERLYSDHEKKNEDRRRGRFTEDVEISPMTIKELRGDEDNFFSC